VVTFGAGRLVVIALVVYVLWRIVCWRRHGGDLLREAVAAVLFGWSLAVACLTFFPMIIIFYDWHGSFSLVPLESTIDLLRYATPRVAFRNIGGNVLLFVPFGVLLPLLFEKLRRPWPLLWRVTIISVAIEVGQLFTRARATDVDDVILNAVGALAGLGLFWAVWAAARRSSRAAAVAARIASRSRREPLLVGAVPVAITTVLLIAALVPPIMAATMSTGDALADATSGLTRGKVVAKADVGGYLFVVARGDKDGAERLRYSEYKRVLPGRYTPTAQGGLPRREASFFSWGLTAYDVVHEAGPVAFVLGRNEAGATSLLVHDQGRGTDRTFPIGKYFLVAFPYDDAADIADDGIINDLRFRFVDASGRDLTGKFARG
jgi:glycopeptide antibiotics resistance protein